MHRKFDCKYSQGLIYQKAVLAVERRRPLLQLQQEVGTTDYSRPSRPRSKSFKVIDFCCNQKPVYDFLLVSIIVT